MSGTSDLVFEEIPGFYQIVPLKVLRRTKGVLFDNIPPELFPNGVHAYDRVLHEGGAYSPGSVGDVLRPWYMHPHQADNLVVLHGIRYVDIYTRQHGKVESFTITPDRVEKNGILVYDGPAMLVWKTGVFHRVESDKVTGSASLNLAVHYPGFDIRTNFNVYDLNVETGEYRVIRPGYLDQPGDI